MPRVLIVPPQFQDERRDCHRVLREAGLEIVLPPVKIAGLPPERLIEQLQGVDAVLASTEPYNAAVLQATNLRVIARCGVGYDSVDVPAATERRVVVTITPGAVERSVAEHALAMILAVNRDLFGRDREVRGGAWTRRAHRRLQGQQLGLVGFGRIGQEVAALARALGLKVVACDPQLDRDVAARLGVEPIDEAALLAESDIVSLHLPCTAATRGWLGAERLARIKPGALLVNTGRGGLVDESALIESLRSGQLGCAALDVFETEPLPLDSPLLQLENVLLTTHTAGLDTTSEEAMSRTAAECVATLYAGRWPEGCVVNDALRNGWMWESPDGTA